MKTVLIIGKKFSDFTSYLDAHGYDWIVLRDIRTTKFPDKKFKKRIVCDFSSETKIIEALAKLKVKPSAVIATYESYVLPAAFIANHLGLPGMPIASAEACTDKYFMRSAFARCPEKISPDFAEVGDEASLIRFANDHSFPLILKPANLAKSLLVSKSSDLDELKENYKKTTSVIDDTYAKYSPNRTPKLVVEEFLEGSVHSVDAFIDSAGNPHIIDGIVDYQTGYDIGYDDNFHYSRIMPTRLSASQQKEFFNCAELGCRSLDMRNSPAHIEIIMTPEGPRIVEIGARNGGYRERMYNLAQGIDITGNALATAMGDPINIHPSKHDPVAVLELFPKHAGIYEGIANLDKLEKLPSLYQIHEKAKPGDFMGKASDGFKMCAMIFLHNPDPKQFQEDLDFINQHVSVLTK